MDYIQEVVLDKKINIHCDGYRHTKNRRQNLIFVSMGFTHMFHTLVTFTKETTI